MFPEFRLKQTARQKSIRKILFLMLFAQGHGHQWEFQETRRLLSKWFLRSTSEHGWHCNHYMSQLKIFLKMVSPPRHDDVIHFCVGGVGFQMELFGYCAFLEPQTSTHHITPGNGFKELSIHLSGELWKPELWTFDNHIFNEDWDFMAPYRWLRLWCLSSGTYACVGGTMIWHFIKGSEMVFALLGIVQWYSAKLPCLWSSDFS